MTFSNDYTGEGAAICVKAASDINLGVATLIAHALHTQAAQAPYYYVLVRGTIAADGSISEINIQVQPSVLILNKDADPSTLAVAVAAIAEPL